MEALLYSSYIRTFLVYAEKNQVQQEETKLSQSFFFKPVTKAASLFI